MQQKKGIDRDSCQIITTAGYRLQQAGAPAPEPGQPIEQVRGRVVVVVGPARQLHPAPAETGETMSLTTKDGVVIRVADKGRALKMANKPKVCKARALSQGEGHDVRNSHPNAGLQGLDADNSKASNSTTLCPVSPRKTADNDVNKVEPEDVEPKYNVSCWGELRRS